MALGITKEEVPAGTLAGAVIEDVRKIISKACPKLPTKKRMKELDMDDEQPLYVLTDGDEDQPFDPEESVVFAEMLLLSEDDCDVSVEAALEALEKAGYEVRWADPLVSSWRGAESSYVSKDLVGAIVVTAQPGLRIDPYVSLGIPVLDCTGAFRGIAGVEQI